MDSVEPKDLFAAADAIAKRWQDNAHRLNHALTYHDISLTEVGTLLTAYRQLKQQQPRVTTLHVVYDCDEDQDTDTFGKPMWYFQSVLRASEAADGGRVMANKAVEEMPAVVIGEIAYLLRSRIPVDVDVGPEEIGKRREAALAKLTEEEKKLLGLTQEE